MWRAEGAWCSNLVMNWKLLELWLVPSLMYFCAVRQVSWKTRGCFPVRVWRVIVFCRLEELGNSYAKQWVLYRNTSLVPGMGCKVFQGSPAKHLSSTLIFLCIVPRPRAVGCSSPVSSHELTCRQGVGWCCTEQEELRLVSVLPA